MKPFRSVISPHQDVLESQTRLEKYAADLWKVHTGEAPDEYGNAERFFNLTYQTGNMRQILSDVEGKLKHGEGDAFMHIETPFGGGKTHTMIAAYHKAKQWGIKTVVIVGTKLSADDTLWGLMEKQLEGKTKLMAGLLSPGGEKIKTLLKQNEPILILIDELLEYAEKAAGKVVGDSTLGAQTEAFVQELAEEVAMLDNVCVIASFPASSDEFIGDRRSRARADKILRSIKKKAGRHDHKITPVSQDDIPNVIRRRLFTTSEKDIERNAKRAVEEHARFCNQNGILPPETTEMQYADRFMKSYPFLPDVIDALYEHWGTISSFQKTRGVLRMLAMVVHRIKDSGKPYITLADFDLSNDTIRRELLQHAGASMDGAITSDITKTGSGASGMKYGVACATVMFMRSFDKDGGKGATTAEIKRAVSGTDTLPANVGDAIEKLKRKLYFMREQDGYYKFTHKPNINHIKNDMDVSDEELREAELDAIKANKGSKINTYVWPPNTVEVDDNDELKLVILNTDDVDTVEKFMRSRGDNNRSNSNAVFVLCPSDEWFGLRSVLRNMVAVKKILQKYPELPTEDTLMLKGELRENQSDVPCNLLNSYNTLYVPSADGPEIVSLGVFTVEQAKISDRIYEKLIGTEIHDTLSPKVLKEIYMKGKETVETRNIFRSMLRDPGNKRPTSEDVIEQAIVDGVIDGTFGLGVKTGASVECKFFKEMPRVTLTPDEVIIRNPVIEKPKTGPVAGDKGGWRVQDKGSGARPPGTSAPKPKTAINNIGINLDVGTGHVSTFSNLLREILNNNFKITVDVKCVEGELDEDAYEHIKDLADDIDRSAKVSS